MDDITLVLASDDNYAQHAAITIASAYEKCSVPQRLKTYILDGGITQEKKDKMQETIEKYKGSIQFINIDTARFANLYTSFQYTAAIYYRLDLPNILPLEIEKCLYVDCDLLFYDDIEKLWDTDLQGHPIGVIEDVGLMTSHKGLAEKQQHLGLNYNSKYFNSGVIVMDLKQWRENNYGQSAIELAVNNDFISHDQDVLNKLFLDNWAELDYRWNVIPPITYLYPKILFSRIYRNKSIIARKNPGILHYAGRYKPWEFVEHKGFNEYYYSLLRKSAFKDVAMPQLSKQNVGRNFTKELVRLKIADIVENIL